MASDLPSHLKNCSYCGTAQHKTNKICVVCLKRFSKPDDGSPPMQGMSSPRQEISLENFEKFKKDLEDPLG